MPDVAPPAYLFRTARTGVADKLTPLYGRGLIHARGMLVNANLSVRVIVSRMFAENCYVISRSDAHRCVIVDPGLDDERIVAVVTENRMQPEAILLTHGHADHIAGVESLKRCWPDCPIIIGRGDAPMLTNADLNLSTQYSFEITSPEADQLVQEGDCLSLAGLEWEVYDTPGHSPGHVVYIWKGSSPWLVVGGDVLFRESVGRSDFPGGNPQQLVDSIESKLFVLPDDTIVLPGHGPSTTIGHEREYNPFVGRRV